MNWKSSEKYKEFLETLTNLLGSPDIVREVKGNYNDCGGAEFKWYFTGNVQSNIPTKFGRDVSAYIEECIPYLYNSLEIKLIYKKTKEILPVFKMPVKKTDFPVLQIIARYV
jgi:hypothetical protein